MVPSFDFDRIVSDETELIVGLGAGRTPDLAFVPADQSVKDTLNAAVVATIEAMRRLDSRQYDPSNEYPSAASVYVTHDELPVNKPRYLHEPTSPGEINDLNKQLLSAKIYLARMIDQDGNRLTAVKRVQGMGKSLERKPLAVIRGGALRVDNEQKFEIEDYVDFLIDAQGVYVYKVTAFEGVCQLEKALRASAVENLQHVQELLPFVDFGPISPTLCKSIRSARVIASIKSKGYAIDLDQQKIVTRCQNADIAYRVEAGKIIVADDSAELFIKLIGKKILESDLKTTGIEVFSVNSSESLH